MHQEALDCFLEALPTLRETAGGLKIKGAVLQNIGAVLNELKRFEESIQYHTDAAAINSEQPKYC